MGLFLKRLTGFFFLFYILISIQFLKYETIVRSSASSFGHSDPDPSSVPYLETYLNTRTCIQICTQLLFILSATSISHKLEIMSKSKSDFLAMNVSWHPNELELYTNQASVTMSTIFTIILIITFLLGVIVQKAIFKLLKRLPQRAINQMIYPYMVKTFVIYLHLDFGFC